MTLFDPVPLFAPVPLRPRREPDFPDTSFAFRGRCSAVENRAIARRIVLLELPPLLGLALLLGVSKPLWLPLAAVQVFHVKHLAARLLAVRLSAVRPQPR